MPARRHPAVQIRTRARSEHRSVYLADTYVGPDPTGGPCALLRCWRATRKHARGAVDREIDGGYLTRCASGCMRWRAHLQTPPLKISEERGVHAAPSVASRERFAGDPAAKARFVSTSLDAVRCIIECSCASAVISCSCSAVT